MFCREVDSGLIHKSSPYRNAERGAHAVIPPSNNARPWKTGTAGAVARNEALRASKYLSRAGSYPMHAQRPGCRPF